MLAIVNNVAAYAPAMAPVSTVQRAASPAMGFGKPELEGTRLSGLQQALIFFSDCALVRDEIEFAAVLGVRDVRSACQGAEPGPWLLGPDRPR